MTIICLEGTSAVGKSTTCKAFAEIYDAYVVEETQVLFGQTNLNGIELVKWFLECQIKRWQIALEKSKEHEFILLDGDVFKLWYDWVYGFDEKLFEYEAEFFREKIFLNEISFPHCYIVLWNDESELRKRKESDKTRSRSGFEKHLKLVEPQIKYFQALNSIVPNFAGIFKAESIEGNLLNIRSQIINSPGVSPDMTLKMFDFMINFLRTTPP
ncbi:chloramphenicol acetyltransferase [Paenibacillus sp. PR3]|uniref:Chloramphenicol acetyltransferase n=1 Tax=Paenibacillus terricola TaxID=2763503 RepID=A0ABR8N0B5_9BACL|nr:chloramphenicol acetyltransferase [Paenibacillus terricola]MBD3919894.1 chloramphenicol acetyltransferase [Paenibacillus terricola]